MTAAELNRGRLEVTAADLYDMHMNISHIVLTIQDVSDIWGTRQQSMHNQGTMSIHCTSTTTTTKYKCYNE